MTSQSCVEENTESAIPEWIDENLIVETMRVWSPRYGHALTTDEAVEILLAFGRLVDAL